MDSKKRDTIIQFIKFNITGVINTVLNYVVYSLLIYAGVGYRISLSVDYILGTMISYFLNKRFTFNIKDKTSLPMVGKMILSYFIIFIINLLLLSFLVEWIKINEYLGQFIAVIIIVIISFLMQKIFVFKA